MDCRSCGGTGQLPRARFPGDTPERCKVCGGVRKPRRRLEAELEGQGSDFLALDGWRSIKTDPPQLRGLGVLEKGMADRLYIRYGYYQNLQQTYRSNVCETLWIEWKSKTGVHGVKQIEWRTAERARGALVWVAKEDFPADYDSFVAFYRASGLLRRVGL